jgi:3-isopropylmalate/(R)-2-methylmalate dehydratase large subunit
MGYLDLLKGNRLVKGERLDGAKMQRIDIMPMTTAEKILARASGRESVIAGEYVTAKIDKFMCHEAFAGVYLNLTMAGISRIPHPDRVLVFLDHYVPAPTQRAAFIHKVVREGVEKFGIKHYYGERAGIAHQAMMELGHVRPGELIVGTDSHTCTYGALGAAACGIGISEMTYAIAAGELWFRVPATIRFVLNGRMKWPLTSKDIILNIAGDYSAEVAQYKSVEFIGIAATAMSVDSRMTMSNMSIEIGAKFGLFEFDEKAAAYLHGKAGGISATVPDKDALYERVYEIDIDHIEPQVALPHAVDNVRPVSQVGEIHVDQAVLGSCTNGRLEDLEMAASILKGKKIHSRVRMLIIPASWNIYQQAMENGTLSILIKAGGIVLNPGCGPCFGAYGGLLTDGEKCISTTNRNFKGRMGSGQAEVYLASPATVAASAVTGRITDPRELI